ncbi:glycosyltransferase [Rhizobium sp. G21]|uniref:glycosyltransferase n=1 Tax=Rhizobium sp. G21 TaxID=2758439 RepID=UPI0016024F1A|nr:glycosyltransferase [Rhizobium sp. G21]MBB1249807.1 glycosyltransferase [Rhizobium sp. G21]
MQTYFSASDVIVLPYENILTSGSVMLSATFGKPVIAPALPTLAEIHQAGFTISYDPQDPDGLTLALEQFLSTSDEVRVEMRRAALDFAERFAWPDISDALETAMLELEKSGDFLELESGKSLEVYDTLSDQTEGQIAVAIVSYYSLHDVDALLETIPRQIDSRDVHIYILCNGRSEREMMHYRDLDRKVVVLVPEENLGYAAGNNAILELALKKRYAYISILNPDMNLRKGCLERLYSAAIQYPGDMLSPAILTADGKISFAGGWVMKDRTLRQKHHLDGQSVAKLPARDYKVDVLNGCALFASADAFKKSVTYRRTIFCTTKKPTGFSVWNSMVLLAASYRMLSQRITRRRMVGWFLLCIIFIILFEIALSSIKMYWVRVITYLTMLFESSETVGASASARMRRLSNPFFSGR